MTDYTLIKTGAEIDAINTKVDGIETGADVTDEGNVSATASVIANTAYKNIGHLPLTGGDLTGNVTTIVNSGNAQTITNSGTGNGLYIDQNGNGNALFIDSEATSTSAFRILQDSIFTGHTSNSSFYTRINNSNSTGTVMHAEQAGTGHGVMIGCTNASQLASGMTISTAGNHNSTNAALKINKNGSGEGAGIQLVNTGTGNGLYIDQNGNGEALNIDSEATTATALYTTGMSNDGYSLSFFKNFGTAYSGLFQRDNSAPTRALLKIEEINSGSSQNTVDVVNAGTGNGLRIDQNGNGVALSIDNAGTGVALMVQQTQDVEVLDFDNCTDGGTTHTTVAGSLKIQMPNGSTGYINFYT
jgi:hypothetical protein